MATLRVVLDTHVLLSGIAYTASVPGKIPAAWRHGSVEVLLSDYILGELRRVLPRLAHRHGLSASEIDDPVDALSIQAEVIEPATASAPDLRDPKDHDVLGTLIAALQNQCCGLLGHRWQRPARAGRTAPDPVARGLLGEACGAVRRLLTADRLGIADKCEIREPGRGCYEARLEDSSRRPRLLTGQSKVRNLAGSCPAAVGGGDDTVRSDRSSFQQRGAVRHRRAGPCGVRAAFTQQLGAGAPFLKTLKALAVESAYNWYWLVDGLMDAGVDVRLVNTAAVPQYAGLKHDNDHTDARHLAHLLRLNLLPEGYIYPREQRGVRDLLRRRFLLVRQSARLTNSLQCAWSRRSGYGIRTNVHTQVDPMERWVLESIRCTPEPQALRSVPGQSRSGVVKA